MTEDKKTKAKDNQIKIIMLILILITAVAVGITIWVLCFQHISPVLSPDYAPQKTEQNAYKIEDDEDGKLEQQQGGGAVSLTYSKEVAIDISEKSATLLFANPSKSNQNIVLQIVIQDTVIAQSGTVYPGYQLDKLNLLERTRLSEGTYDGKFVILFYQPDSGEKAVLNTEIPLKITVQQ